jgi:phosphate acetyltransferase
MSIMDAFYRKAKAAPRTIALPEAAEPRMLAAARRAADAGYCTPLLVGDGEQIRTVAAAEGIDIADLQLVDVRSSPLLLDRYASQYAAIRQQREAIARTVLSRPIYFAGFMTGQGDADGMVSGCLSTTATVVKAAMLTIGLREGITVPSSCFIMEVPDCPYGEAGVLLFVDPAINPNPTARQLAEIAASGAVTAKVLLGWEPRVAMLSFSTKGSAVEPDTVKVVGALNILAEEFPHVTADGEFQVDTAIVPEVARRKVKGPSPVAGRANVLVFPDLDAANCGYKLTQWLGKARAVGPIMQGFKRPVNDLSRGASVSDIVDVIAVTVCQAGGERQGTTDKPSAGHARNPRKTTKTTETPRNTKAPGKPFIV